MTQRLPDHKRNRIIRLYYDQHLTQKEIARVLDVSTYPISTTLKEYRNANDPGKFSRTRDQMQRDKTRPAKGNYASEIVDRW